MDLDPGDVFVIDLQCPRRFLQAVTVKRDGQRREQDRGGSERPHDVRTGPRVLLADDHRIVAEALKSLLEQEFELVAVVEDGRQLVEAARRLRPDVIIERYYNFGGEGIGAAAAIGGLTA